MSQAFVAERDPGRYLAIPRFRHRSRASQILVSGPNAFGVVAITDDATAFAAVTASASGGRIRYAVEVWRVATAARLARD